MASDAEALDDDTLEAHVRARVTAELIEWAKRRLEACAKSQEALTSAGFNFRLGYREGARELRDALQQLLTEALDPEFEH